MIDKYFFPGLGNLFLKVCYFGKLTLVVCDFALPQKTACLQFLAQIANISRKQS